VSVNQGAQTRLQKCIRESEIDSANRPDRADVEISWFAAIRRFAGYTDRSDFGVLTRLWVKNRFDRNQSLPVYPDQRTSTERAPLVRFANKRLMRRS
jgi:hypothetical protein